MKRMKFKNLNKKQWLRLVIAIALTLTKFDVMAQDAKMRVLMKQIHKYDATLIQGLILCMLLGQS